MSGLGEDLERAHRLGVRAADSGLRDAALGPLRLRGTAVPALAEAAVSSATPFLRAPLLSRLSRIALLHPAAGARCPSCAVEAPCPTAREVAR